MEITPDMYLNLDNVEMHGPSAIRFKDEAESAPTPAPQTIDEVAAALRQAELAGKHGEVGILSAQLDGLLASTSSSPTETSNNDAPDEVSEDNEEVKEAPDEFDFQESDFNKSLVNELGQEETTELYEIVNSTGDNDVIKGFLESAQGDGKYATEVVDWARHAKASGATPTADVELAAFDETSAAQLLGASEYGQDILDLNHAATTGKISRAEMYTKVLSNPALMAEAVRLRNANILQF